MVSPIIDLIDWRTFQYNATQWPVRGVFDWRLDFHWDSSGLQPQEKESGSAVEALRSVLGWRWCPVEGWERGGESFLFTHDVR